MNIRRQIRSSSISMAPDHGVTAVFKQKQCITMDRRDENNFILTLHEKKHMGSLQHR